MKTQRTTLSPVISIDYESLYALYQDPKVRMHLGGIVKKSDFDEKFANFLIAKAPEVYFVARDQENNEFIGLVSITKYHDGKNFEVSYELDTRYWGDGYGTEIVREVVRYGFEELNISELYAETQKKNTSSVRLLEKIGMEFVLELERFGEAQVVYSIKKKNE